MVTAILENKAVPIPKTVVPKNVTLTAVQNIELCNLERLYAARNHEDSQLRRIFYVESTRNEGVHYFSIENNLFTNVLLSNEHISFETARLLFEERKAIGDIGRILYLLENRVAGNNLAFFKEILDVVGHQEKETVIALASAVVNNKLSIEVFMFVMETPISTVHMYIIALLCGRLLSSVKVKLKLG